MGYDLLFWKERNGRGLDPGTVCEALADEQPVHGLADFPVEDYLESVLAAFPEAVRESNGAQEWVYWENPRGRGVFEIRWSPVHVWVTVRNIEAEDGNQLVDLAANLDAPLYDPQTGERFDSWISPGDNTAPRTSPSDRGLPAP